MNTDKVSQGNAEIANEPAFPALDANVIDGQATLMLRYNGLSKREYFAAMAMQGMLANPALVINGNSDTIMGVINQLAIEHANDLINQLNARTDE